MKEIKDITFGYSDAENYKKRENKELFNHLFVRNALLDKIVDLSTTFLVGDKGTGKTAYAVYMANNEHANTACTIRYIRETEYQKFVQLKAEERLNLSDFASIWKVIIYLLLSNQINEKEKTWGSIRQKKKFTALQNAMDEYYMRAFSPEIDINNALELVKESKRAATIMSKHMEVASEENKSTLYRESSFQLNLMYIQKHFESALGSLQLKKNHIVFIDGIDVRPTTISYKEYLECIKGLANAVWEINNDFSPSIRDSPGRIRAILLVRPDIYASLGLQNQNTKIRDNAVVLKWDTRYKNYRDSDLFKLSDRLLSYEQPDRERLKLGEAWNYYFNFDAPSVGMDVERPSSFLSFLRFSLHRPRDIVTMLKMLKERYVESPDNFGRLFTSDDFNDSVFRRNYADYLLGEVKDQLSFYYSAEEYDIFLKFFSYLEGKNRFTYEEYLSAFHMHSRFMEDVGMDIPEFMGAPEEFLQFLYELNTISYKEKTKSSNPYIHWCFVERSYSNVSPKVKVGREYEIFYGMSKALNTGTRFVR